MLDAKQFAEAVWNGDLSAVNEMLANGADPNLADEDRYPPILLAIEQQYTAIVRRLIEAGADVNRPFAEDWTPLAHAIDTESDAAWQAHYELGHESTELTELLLASGAVPNARAFKLAEEYGNRKALELLRRHWSERRETPQ
jgi:ankyrin repeat protein